MKVFFRNLALILCVWLMTAGICLGKQVYLRDGSIVDCQSFWKQGDKVMVKINRDVIVDFQKSEVNMKRTFHETAKKTHHARQKAATGEALTTEAKVPVAAAAPAPAPKTRKALPLTAQPAPGPATRPASVPAPAPVPAQQPAQSAPAPAPTDNRPVAAQQEPEQPAAADSAAPMSKEELQAKKKEIAEMMIQAMKNNDQELMKKAIEMQKSINQANVPNPAAAGNLFGIMALIRKFMFISLIISLLIIVSMWITFEKAGQAGWKSLIPIYNCYILLVMSDKPGWWLLLLFIPFVGFVFYLLAMLDLAKKFGKGAGFGIGLSLLPMIFFPWLAFDGSQYEG